MSHAAPIDFTFRPGLAYQHAFDWLALQMHAANKPIVCRASLPLHRRELAQRGLGDHLLDALSGEQSPAFSTICWIEPTIADLPQLVQTQQWLLPDGRMHLLVAGPLSRFLAEHRLSANGYHFAKEKAVTTVLQQNGWRISQRLGLHGIAAIAWHLASRVTAQLGRLDWQDRCHYGMRRSFAIRRSGVAALICLTAERGA